jgi:UDP-N-acetylmuramoyl-tripeptide--D-alanyl-D-alanine ligase
VDRLPESNQQSLKTNIKPRSVMDTGFLFMNKQISDIYPLFRAHPVVSTDSRHVPPGSIFFALRGESFNGNEFAGKALDSGAAYAVVDEAAYATGNAHILVDNVLETLQHLAHHHRMQFNIPVIAITGSNGKTTTKELISGVLSRKFKTVATPGNLNNHIGVPLTLLNITSETEIAVVEMGANHPGEIGFLCNIAHPGYGIITNIGKAHLEGFGSFEGVVRTKTELYHFLREHHGKVFLNQDDELLVSHAENIMTITYGSSDAALAARNISAEPFITMDLQLENKDCMHVESRLYGTYNAVNMMAAACIGQYFHVDPADIRSAIEGYEPGNNRSQVTRTERNLLILDAYNANPSSMKAALETFASSPYPEKTIILGDMLELGSDTDQEHMAILGLICQQAFKKVYLVGPVFTRLNTAREHICFHDCELARIWLEHHRIENQTILLKGSRGIRLEKLVDLL